MQINAVYIIVKLVERCNLNCSYCYYYAPNNSDVFSRPTIASFERLESLVEYLREAVIEHSLKRVVLGLHGGEPTLAKAGDVRKFCQLVQERLSGLTSIGFTLQTNAVHLSDEWIDLISDTRMGVGVSIDGDKETHDRYRVDHRGRGSYERVCSNLAKLVEMDRRAKCHLSVLAVMSDQFSGVDHYRHITEDLGVRRFKPLFVDRTREQPLGSSELELLGEKLCDMFDYWLSNHSRTVEVMMFRSIVRELLAEKHGLRGARDRVTLAFAVHSNGNIRIQDDYIVTEDWYRSQVDLNTDTSRFSDYIDQPHLRQMVRSLVAPPKSCVGCDFAFTCAGGEVAHRFDAKNAFDNSSVYCRSLYMLHSHARKRLGEGEAMLRKTPREVAFA